MNYKEYEIFLNTVSENIPQKLKNIVFNTYNMQSMHIYNKAIMSMEKLLTIIAECNIPYINNSKMFMFDPDEYPTKPLDITIYRKFATLVLSDSLNKDLFSKVNTHDDFKNTVNNAPLTTNKIACIFFLKHCPEHINSLSYHNLMLLNAIISNELLLKKNINITSDNIFTEDTCDYLNSINLAIYNTTLTLFSFSILYMRTKQQRQKDFPVIFDENYERSYTQSEAAQILFNQKSDPDISRQMKTILNNIYSALGLKRKSETEFTYDEMVMLVIWYMLYRNKNSKLSDFISFPKIIKGNINLNIMHQQYCIDNVVNDHFIFENKWNDNSAVIVNNVIFELPTVVIDNIPCVTLWNEIMKLINSYNINYVLDFLKAKAKYIDFQVNESDYLLDDYQYFLNMYSFATGIDTMKTVYNSINEHKHLFNSNGIDLKSKSNVSMNPDLFFSKEYLVQNQYWKLLITKEEQECEKLESRLIQKRKTIRDYMKIIHQQVNYSERDYAAFTWLYFHGKDIAISYPIGYQKNTNSSQNMHALLISPDYSIFHTITITQYIHNYVNYITTSCYGDLIQAKTTIYSELMNLINFIRSNYSPKQGWLYLYEILNQLYDEIANPKKICQRLITLPGVLSQIKLFFSKNAIFKVLFLLL